MQTHRIVLPEISVAVPIALFMGWLMTMALFLLMQDLIRFKGEVPQLAEVMQITDFVRLIEEPEPVPEPFPEPPVKVTPPPEVIPDLGPAEGFDEIGVQIAPPIGLSGVRPTVAAPDGDALPIVAVAPAYPRSALARGIEGYVIIRFNIDELGRVVDPSVVEAKPPGVFERSALTAIAKYRYKPKIVGGAAKPVSDVFQRLSFELTR